MRIDIACVLVAVLSCAPLRAAPAPLALHPDNPHYFLFRDKPTVLITSGEHYGAVLNGDFDYVRYLDELHANHLNLTRLFAGTYHEVSGNFGIEQNTLSPAAGAFIPPWARSDTPGAIDGQNKFDLGKFNPKFFDRLHDFLHQASDRGVVVEVNLFCPSYDDSMWNVSAMNPRNNINALGDVPRDEAYTIKHAALLKAQDAFVRRIVDECRDFDNVYFEVCNEPYFGGVTIEWQAHIVQTIGDAEKAMPARHLISMNIANGSQKIEKPDERVSIFNFHYCAPPDAVKQNAALPKVIGNNETGFKGSDDVVYRQQAWNFIIAGGALFNNLDYSFTVGHPDGSLRGYKAPGGGSAELRAQYKILHDFIDRFDFLKMNPDEKVIGALPAGVAARALSEPGRQYAIYVTGGKQVKLQLDLPPGNYLAQWIDTTTGKAQAPELVKSDGGALTLTSPEYENDVALSVRVGKSRGD